MCSVARAIVGLAERREIHYALRNGAKPAPGRKTTDHRRHDVCIAQSRTAPDRKPGHVHLKLRHLAVFRAVMEEGSVSKAATRLGLTQPAVSMALTKLEELVGYSLFDRAKGSFVPKPEARDLQADAELAILAFESFEMKAELIGRRTNGLVRVGAIGSAAANFLPDVISRFTEGVPGVEVHLQVRSSAQITELVAAQQIDIGLVEGPVAAASIAERPYRIPCVCIMKASDPVASVTQVTPRTLSEVRLISVFQDHPLDRQIRSAFDEAGLTWRSDVRSNFFSIMRNLVSRGAGVAIVDALNGCADLNDGVVWRPFAPQLTYELAVITHATAPLRAPAAQFLTTTEALLSLACSLPPRP
ncbi:MAG: LysR substrate-binding domain-containing protein [Pseudomonadota bacterium]